VSVERPPQGGAAFLVDLPAAPADVALHATPVPDPAPAAPAAKRAILLVDDDPAVRRMVKALFGREGHTVDVARNVQHALDLAGARSYDLILADAQARARAPLFETRRGGAHGPLKHGALVAAGDVGRGGRHAEPRRAA